MRKLARAGALVTVIALTGACGARNALLDDEPPGDGGVGVGDTGRSDADRPDGSRPDGSRPDGSSPDAGVERCVAEVVVGPTQVGYSASDSTADRPQAERRAGAFYLLHTMRGDRDAVTPYGNPFDDGLSPFGGLSSAVYGATEAYVTAANEARLGYCFDTRAGVTLVGDSSPPTRPGSPATRISYDFGGHCQDLRTNGGSWFAAFTNTTGPRGAEPLFMLTTPDLMGLFTMPSPAFVETFVPERELRATVLSGGAYAYTAQPTRERLLEVGIVTDDGFVRTFVIPDVAPTGSPPGIAPWPFDDESIAIAHNFPEGVRVLVVGRDGEERFRTEPLTFSMAGDVTPALAALPGGLVVATLNYGDADPDGGVFQVHVVDEDGAPREVYARETRRGSLRYGGIDALADDRRALIHWAETAELSIGVAATTQALIVECAEP